MAAALFGGLYGTGHQLVADGRRHRRRQAGPVQRLPLLTGVVDQVYRRRLHIGALLVGVNFAKSVACALGKPLIPVLPDHRRRRLIAGGFKC